MSLVIWIGVMFFSSWVLLGTFFLLTVEWWVPFLFPILSTLPAGLQASSRSAFCSKKLKFSNPRVLIFEESFPMGWAIRGLGGRGLLLLSQGVVAMRDERQLQQVLAQAAERLGDLSTSWESVVMLMTFCFSRMRWSGWSPIVFLLQWAVYPYSKYFLVLSDRRKISVGLSFYSAPDLMHSSRQG